MSANTVNNSFWTGACQPGKVLMAVVLNYNLPDQVEKLLSKAQFCICADGGANRLYSSLSTHSKRQQYKPAVIAGDLDSITPEVQQYYANLGTEVVDQSHDQDTTDLQKCLSQLESRFDRQQLADCTIVAAGGVGGRLDHVLSALSTLHKWSHLHLILWGDGSTVQLLRHGRHIITPARGFEGPTCGLVPLNGPATLTTKGLKWNMEQTRSEFTGMISTSNQIVGDTVEVETDADVVWITEVMH